MEQMQTLEFERRGRVGWLRLNRPEKLNAMNGVLWRELAELGPRLRDDPDLRALVVIGNGRAFSAGIDLATFGGSAAESPPDVLTDRSMAERERAIADIQEGYLWLHEAWYPTIAAVRGYALGAGFQLALACDLRIAAAGTRMGMLEARYGLMPDLTGTQMLPRLVGPAKAKELIFTAAQIDADEALRIGVINRIVADDELEAAAATLAEQLAAQPPLAIAGAKRAVDAGAHLPLREALRFEHRGQAACVASRDFTEAIAATAERRPPVYTGH
jgi:enoyl-CoA hydratase/carnithine racemase